MAKCKDCFHFYVCQRYGATHDDFDVDDGVCRYFDKKLVLCKDCKHFYAAHIDRGYCDLEQEAHGTSCIWYINDFCSYGERKDNGQA